jgi:peptidyl-tRNA hydrolase, PTH1 family
VVGKQLVIVGLGNPGKKYAYTRHNVGFMVVERLAHLLGLQIKREKHCDADVARGVVGTTSWHCLFPLTYMNLSGIAVRRYLDYYNLSVDDLLVIADDVEFAVGEFRLKGLGGPGGHNGLKSLEQHLSTRNYKRLRVGVGAPGKEGNPLIPLEDFVLAPFTFKEQEQLPTLLEAAVAIVRRLETEEIEKVMNVVNERKRPHLEQSTITPTPPVGQEKQNGKKETEPL